jgi:hypothetical protein
MPSFEFIPTESGMPFAVVKKRNGNAKNAQKEVFCSSFACEMGLRGSVAQSILISHSKLGKDVVLEEYIRYSSVESSKIQSPAVAKLIQTFQSSDNINLANILSVSKGLKDNTQALIDNLDVDSVHKFFSLVFLEAYFDSVAQNIALRLNAESKFEFVCYDFQYAFSAEWRTFVFVMPFLDVPFSEEVKNIIYSWTPEKLYKMENEITDYSERSSAFPSDNYIFTSHVERLKNIQSHLRLQTQATPRDILFFAFFDNPSQAYQMLKYMHEYTDERVSLWGNESSANEIGTYFAAYDAEECRYGNTEYDNAYRGYAGAIFDYNESILPNTSKTLSGFLNFIPTWKHFRQEKRDDYIIYIKMKFNIDLT